MPVKFAVIVPAAKLPEPSRSTRVFGIFAEVAEVTVVAKVHAGTPQTNATVFADDRPVTSPASVMVAVATTETVSHISWSGFVLAIANTCPTVPVVCGNIKVKLSVAGLACSAPILPFAPSNSKVSVSMRLVSIVCALRV